jgi:hypothetical protein
MVDAHQRSGLSALGFVQLQLGHPSGWIGATGAGLSPKSAQGTVGGQNQGIDHHKSVNNRPFREAKRQYALVSAKTNEFAVVNNLSLKPNGSLCWH